MKLKPGTIEHLQEYIAEKIKKRGFEDESLQERLILLMEEVGELAKASRPITGMYTDDKRQKTYGKIGQEAVDILNLLFAIVIALGIDFEKEFVEKEAKIDKRLYERR